MCAYVCIYTLCDLNSMANSKYCDRFLMMPLNLYQCFVSILPRLEKGDSGSIVYTIDKDDRKLYALAMLICIWKDNEISAGGRVYQAAVLWPSLKQIESHLKHRIKNIQIVGVDHISGRKPENVIPSMVSLDTGIFEY